MLACYALHIEVRKTSRLQKRVAESAISLFFGNFALTHLVSAIYWTSTIYVKTIVSAIY